jgi:hypothetical protein
MAQDEIIEMARQAGFEDFVRWSEQYPHEVQRWIERMTAFAHLVAAKERETYMQLFLDPENQPTQFGTATQEYRTQEIQEIQSLLTEIANIVRTKHLYGSEMKKLLAKEEAIRARGEQT